MTIPYRSRAFIPPPRADSAIPPSDLPIYERRGWWAQYKKNGTYNVIFSGYEGYEPRLSALKRDGSPHRNWDFTPASRRAFRRLPGKGWYVFCTELLHSKVSGIRDKNYIHDILVDDGQYLLGETYKERYDRLTRLFPVDSSLNPSYYRVDESTFVARNIRAGFPYLFTNLSLPEDEGLVLKDPNAKLSIGSHFPWTVKCRRPHRNYGF